MSVARIEFGVVSVLGPSLSQETQQNNKLFDHELGLNRRKSGCAHRSRCEQCRPPRQPSPHKHGFALIPPSAGQKRRQRRRVELQIVGPAPGYTSGVALRLVGRVAAVGVGCTFCIVQGLAYQGYIRVDWRQVERGYLKLLDVDGVIWVGATQGSSGVRRGGGGARRRCLWVQRSTLRQTFGTTSEP